MSIILLFCALSSPDPSSFRECLPRRTVSEPAPRQYIPSATNLRSSAPCPPPCIDTYLHVWLCHMCGRRQLAQRLTWMRPPEVRLGAFICGSFFAGAPPVLPRNRTRMTPIKRIFTDSFRAHPRHPCNPCYMAASLFAEAPGETKIVEESIFGNKNPEVQGHDGQA